MLIIRGEPALSTSRIEKKLTSIKQIYPQATSVDTYYLYLLKLSTDLNSEELSRLQSLLHAKDVDIKSKDLTGSLLVVPRPGTISPWASKATDIIHHCAIQKISRIERSIFWKIGYEEGFQPSELIQKEIESVIHDRMTECVLHKITEAEKLFQQYEPRQLTNIDLLTQGKDELLKANAEMGLALSAIEIDYLYDVFLKIERNPTDVELMMFAQANSEHCRHKIFKSNWTIDDTDMPSSLFEMIQSTYQHHPGRVLSAYKDNAAVMQGYTASRFYPTPSNRQYTENAEDVHIVMKVETHNHPTAISPYPGAATGAGGEIRDEAATGTGAKPKAGLTGFVVSNLQIPTDTKPWEIDHGKPDRIVSALDIMLEGPIGAASFNNEFGRPALAGYFRSYEQTDPESNTIYGYHKPIMLAGGYGIIRDPHINKKQIPPKAKLIVLGGPAMLIGLGGGATSSMASGKSDAALDYASVQRDNPEMQRRCQEVIDCCWALGENNPIISIHDVGAGGLSNALPELVNYSNKGALFKLREIPCDDPGMSPMEIWCNESQERYVLAINSDDMDTFTTLCQRETAPFAVIGEATDSGQLQLSDNLFNNQPIDLPLSVLFDSPSRMQRKDNHIHQQRQPITYKGIEFDDAVNRVLQLPTIADKRFLITIGDRSVSGLVVRDQMVGPWQTPVADCAITASSYDAYVGEAMAIGERSPVAIINPPASGRLALAEAITNIAASRILRLSDIALSANWMAACGHPGEDANLYDTVEAVSNLATSLEICIPGGKDSLSMHTVWEDGKEHKQVISPLSVNISAFAPVADIRKTLTPQLIHDKETSLLLIDLGNNQNRMGGSALAQVFNQIGDVTPDIDRPELLTAFFQAIQLLNEMDLIMSYHDRSDGGLFVTLTEMAFAGHCGIDILLECNNNEIFANLFNEEVGAVIQIDTEQMEQVCKTFLDSGLAEEYISVIGNINNTRSLTISNNGTTVFTRDLAVLHALWSSTTINIQAMRDNPQCAQQELESLLDMNDPGLSLSTSFDMNENAGTHSVNTGVKPDIAILREQGVNGHVEMAAVFHRASFNCIDVHMNDLIDGSVSLTQFRGIAACGGFSYGDVLGAGGGWAKSILFNSQLRDEFEQFFTRENTFGLGVCNGCQMLSQLKELIPGAETWPDFIRNQSEQFEARLVMVEVTQSPCILTNDMAGSKIPIVVAHGEGRAIFNNEHPQDSAQSFLRYIDNYGKCTEHYPANPAGTPGGLTGFTTTDGRFSILMPHPERVFLKKQFSWIPDDWHYEDSPWIRLFQNARKWLD